jgi:phosphoserine phosphatase
MNGLAGVGVQVRAITEAAMNGEIDFSESFKNVWLCSKD